MKLGLLILFLAVVGCSHSLPPEPPYVETVTKHRLPLPKTKGEVVSVEVEAPPVRTWLSKEEVDAIRLQEAIEKAAKEDPCQAGDPLCDHIQRPVQVQ